MATIINIKNLKTLEEELNLLPKNYNNWYSISVDITRNMFQEKTFICKDKEESKVFKYTIKPDIAFDSYKIQYNVAAKVDVTKDYVENLKTLEEELNLLPKNYIDAYDKYISTPFQVSLEMLALIPIFNLRFATMLWSDSRVLQNKTFICTKDNKVLQYTVKPELSHNRYTMEYDASKEIDITTDYIIVDELNTIDNIAVDAL
jgi:hypothetical protein